MSAHILLIEDDKEMITLGKIILEKEGYTVLTALDGAAGLNVLADNKDKIDLILLDIMLPKIYGWEILERIKANTETQHIPVIILTARHYLENEAETEKYAKLFSSYIVKPFVVRDLLNQIATVLSMSKVVETG